MGEPTAVIFTWSIGGSGEVTLTQNPRKWPKHIHVSAGLLVIGSEVFRRDGDFAHFGGRGLSPATYQLRYVPGADWLEADLVETHLASKLASNSADGPEPSRTPTD